MKKQTKPALRLYCLTMYNISEIQKSIQALHATVEYALKYGKDKEYIDWAKHHKTVVILNGGTSNDGHHSEYGEPKQEGSMETYFKTLKANKIKCAAFYEPDLNYSCSAIAFLVDERVFNKKDYPDFGTQDDDNWNAITETEQYRKYEITRIKLTKDWERNKLRRKSFYISKVGKDVAFLKDFLKPLRLA